MPKLPVWLCKGSFVAGVVLFGASWCGGLIHEVATAHALPSSNVEHFAKADALVEKGDYPPALDQYRLGTVIRRDMPEGFLGLAEIHKLTGNAQGEEKAYRDLLDARPHDLAGRARLGELLRAQGRTEEALDQFRVLAGRVPRDGEVQLRLGVLMLSTRRYGEAEEQLASVFALLPEDARVFNNYGVALISQGKTGLATRAFEAAVKLNPRIDGYRSNLNAARAACEAASKPAADAASAEGKHE